MSPRPYRLGQREAAASQTRARILEAARSLLASESGPGSFSIDAVASAAGVVRMTVYYQFKSKQGLLEALFDDLARRGGLEAIPTAFVKDDPLEAVDSLIAIFCGFYHSERVVLRRLRAAALLDPELEASLRARDGMRRRALQTLIGRLRDARGENESDDSVTDSIDLLQALTSFESFEILAATRGPERVAQLMSQTARGLLSVNGQSSVHIRPSFGQPSTARPRKREAR